jgi:iron transport multicopper oxidase
MRSWLPILSLASAGLAKTVTYNWRVGWLIANPDGLANRPVIAVNGQWPPPTIEADLGDTIVVNVHNALGNETTSLHFHGQFQTGTPGMDGPVGANQCPIPVGSSFTYKFTANPSGTFWWHSHNSQYPDGLRGPLIVHDAKYEKALGYDQAYTLTVSDWYVKLFHGVSHG